MAKATIDGKRFGVEIECIIPPRVSYQMVVEALRAAGLNVRNFEGYTHRGTDAWKVTTDGSVGGTTPRPRPFRSAEIVSPILQGEDGFRQIETVCSVLESLGAEVNVSCGLHVHHEVLGWNVETFKKLVAFYKGFENVIDEGIAPSRRGNRSRWAPSVQRLTDSTIENAVAGRCGQRGGQRYNKLNLLNFAYTGTVEFRHHQGTLNAEKIRNWVVLTNSILRTAERMRSTSLRNVGTWKAFRRNLFVVQNAQGETLQDRDAQLTYEALDFFNARRKHFARQERQGRRVA